MIGAVAAAAAFLVSPAALDGATTTEEEAASAGAVGVTSAPATAATVADRASRAITKEKKTRPRAMVTGESGERWGDGEGEERGDWALPELFEKWSRPLPFSLSLPRFCSFLFFTHWNEKLEG